MDDIGSEGTDDRGNKSINDSMQNYVSYLSLDSVPKCDQTPEECFNPDSSISIIDEKVIQSKNVKNRTCFTFSFC